jgi:hypothetical protein
MLSFKTGLPIKIELELQTGEVKVLNLNFIGTKDYASCLKPNSIEFLEKKAKLMLEAGKKEQHDEMVKTIADRKIALMDQNKPFDDGSALKEMIFTAFAESEDLTKLKVIIATLNYTQLVNLFNYIHTLIEGAKKKQSEKLESL